MVKGNDARKMEEVKAWLRGNSNIQEKNDLFGAIDLGGRMALEQEEEDTFGCIPVAEVDQLLKKCAYELGMTYEH